MTRTAILGWGSLLWDRRALQVPGQWHSDGPWLPIEFARTSGLQDDEPYLSLVLHPNAGLIRTYWDVSLLTEHRDDVICDLRKRERCNLSAIAYLPKGRYSVAPTIPGVIWTNLEPKLSDRIEFTIKDSIEWLTGLRNAKKAATAERYIRMAPSQTDTCLRRQVREEFGWTDIPIGF
jgi:hypothetical protein